MLPNPFHPSVAPRRDRPVHAAHPSLRERCRPAENSYGENRVVTEDRVLTSPRKPGAVAQWSEQRTHNFAGRCPFLSSLRLIGTSCSFFRSRKSRPSCVGVVSGTQLNVVGKRGRPRRHRPARARSTPRRPLALHAFVLERVTGQDALPCDKGLHRLTLCNRPDAAIPAP
jgi:hypothetical protein